MAGFEVATHGRFWVATEDNDKSKTFRPTCIAVGYELHRLNTPVLCKCIGEVALCRLKGQISNK